MIQTSQKYTYDELLKEVAQFANALKELGVNKGDRVCIYMQMIPELAISILACARIELFIQSYLVHFKRFLERSN